MNKACFYLFLSLIFFFLTARCRTKDSSDSFHDGVQPELNYRKISLLTEWVTKRAYFFSRLQQIPVILDSLDKKYLNKDAEDILYLWGIISRFGFVESNKLVNVLVDKAYSFFNKVFVQIGYSKEGLPTVDLKDDNVSLLAKKIHTIDFITATILEKEYFSGWQVESVSEIERDIENYDYDRAIYRFYLIKKLKNAFKLFNTVHEKKITFFPFALSENNFIDIQLFNKIIKNNKVRLLVDQIFETKSIKPLLIVWGRLQWYYYISDQEFITDLMIVILLLHHSLIIHNANDVIDYLNQDDALFVMEIIDNKISILQEEVLNHIYVTQEKVDDLVTKVLVSLPWYKASIVWLLGSK